MDRCEVPRCRREAYVNYLGHLVCERHWDQLTADDAPPDALRMALAIEPAPVAAMEEAMDDGNKKTTKPEAGEKTEAAGKPSKKAKAPKEPRPAKESKASKREAIDNRVVFAFRLSEADRTRIHEAAGPAGATRFVRSAALAAAMGDTKAFEALVAQAKSNLTK